MKRLSVLILAALAVLSSCSKTEEPAVYENTEVVSTTFNGKSVKDTQTQTGVSADNICWVLTFSKSLNASKFDSNQVAVTGTSIDNFDFIIEDNVLTIRANKTLPYSTTVRIYLYEGKNWGVNIIYRYTLTCVTEYDPTDKFERISDDELFEKVQRAAFDYYWDYRHPVSGLARERSGSGETCTIGGSGMCLMGVPVGIERGWISREEGAQSVLNTVTFLQDKAQRFHGVWSHWLNGTTGAAIAFSTYDDGADLVETSFMIEGLLALRQYFNGADAVETEIRSRITTLWEEVEWTWFQQDGQNRLFWHWSSNYGWKMNMAISGWNEAMITYVLAAASPTYPIEKVVYDEGWAANGSNTYSFYSPLFFVHYSFLGLDPRNLKNQYADYWEQNCKHVETNWKYCATSTKGYGYSDVCWGLTASDYYDGYTASSPSNDTGTVAPTAALASFPYAPEHSKAAMEYFYYTLGDRLWGTYGFRDAFALKKNWFATSYIAIDEGPIVVMMENYRTGLLWDCFMADTDMQRGLDRLGFEYK